MADDLHELSALYALDALTGDDRARFERHLADCDECRDELAGLRGAGAAMAFAVEGPPAPAALRGRVLAAVRAEPQNVVPLRRRPSLAVSIASVVAVAATAAAVAFGVWAASLNHSLAHERSAVGVLGNPASRHVPLPRTNGQLVVAPSGDAVLSIALPSPPNGKTYEAWVASPTIRAAGTFTGSTVKLTQPVRAGDLVMVTLEHDGGTHAPTSRPIVTVRA